MAGGIYRYGNVYGNVADTFMADTDIFANSRSDYQCNMMAASHALVVLILVHVIGSARGNRNPTSRLENYIHAFT